MPRFTKWLARIVFGPRVRLAYAPIRRTTAIVLFLLSFGTSIHAQLPDAQLRTLGLQTAWSAQLQMPAEEGRIVSTHLWTNPSQKRTFAELTLPPGMSGVAMGGGRTLRASADQLGLNGEPIGIEGAKKQVETQAARLLGRAAGIPAVEVTVPLIYLAVVTSDGFVQNFDAETGQKLWSNTCGSLRAPAAPASVSDVGIVVAQGQYLYLFDWNSGKIVSKREMKRGSSAGVAMIDDMAFVSSLSGQLMAFEFGEPTSANHWTFRLYGRAVTRPAASDRTHKLVAFATENGVVTVISADEKVGPWFNFEARSPLAGPLTFVGGGLYCGDIQGQISKIGLDRMGRVEWRLMIGGALNNTPIVANRTIYLSNELGELFAADDSTGILRWQSPSARVKSVLAVSGSRLYCRSLTDRLLVVDINNGKIIGQTGDSLIGTDVVNQLDDRLYIISATGRIQGLRESGKEHALPMFHEAQPVPTEETTPKPAEALPARETETPTTDANTDPFGTASDPADAFGAPATPPAAAESDPFAAPPAGTDSTVNPFN